MSRLMTVSKKWARWYNGLPAEQASNAYRYALEETMKMDDVNESTLLDFARKYLDHGSLTNHESQELKRVTNEVDIRYLKSHSKGEADSIWMPLFLQARIGFSLLIVTGNLNVSGYDEAIYELLKAAHDEHKLCHSIKSYINR